MTPKELEKKIKAEIPKNIRELVIDHLDIEMLEEDIVAEPDRFEEIWDETISLWRMRIRDYTYYLQRLEQILWTADQ